MYFSVEVYRKDGTTYVASCPELDVFSYGRTIDAAVDRLKRIIDFYLESAKEMGLSLEELGLAPHEQNIEESIPQRVSSIREDAYLN